jgi:hypothetical protein
MEFIKKIFSNVFTNEDGSFSILKTGIMAAGVLGGGLLFGDGFNLIGALAGGGAALLINNLALGGKKEGAPDPVAQTTPGGQKPADGAAQAMDVLKGPAQDAFGAAFGGPGLAGAPAATKPPTSPGK